jgi:hypothetical protein
MWTAAALVCRSFGPSAWLRSLIRPEPGMAVAYLDWSQQELAIAAALSGDKKMQNAYESGDFYLTFAKMAGAVPPDATKESHAAVREQFKTVALGVLYGLSAEGLARKLNVTPSGSSGAGRMPCRTKPSSPAGSAPCSAGRSTPATSRTPGR